jgi:predicted RNA-binding Zn-ribbon protein involved in translation (DUF1610 family)
MDNVERLHRALVAAIRQTRGDNFDQPVTVSEIYQTLLPYRAARTVVGFDMNADYEYALLRLLAGEGGLARLEPIEVRESLRNELESPNPNVALYRQYANCDVWVAPTFTGDSPAGWTAEEPDDPDFEEDDDVSIVNQPPTAVPVMASPLPQQCAFCGGELPAGRLLNFCPFCGNDLAQRPCSNCGEFLVPMWKFCANCGAPAAGFVLEAY